MSYGSTSSGGIPVYINSDGQLGTQPASMRSKGELRNRGDSTDALMKVIKTQKQKIEELEQRLSRLEKMVSNQALAIAQK